MIPTVLLAGLVLGLAVRMWWSIPVLGVFWAALVAIETRDLDIATLGVALLLGVVNAGVGVSLGRGVRYLLSLVRGRGRVRRRADRASS